MNKSHVRRFNRRTWLFFLFFTFSAYDYDAS